MLDIQSDVMEKQIFKYCIPMSLYTCGTVFESFLLSCIINNLCGGFSV